MKKATIALATVFLSFSVFSQTKEDYKNTLNLVKEAYNKKDGSLIHQKFSQNLKKELQEASFEKMIDSLHGNKGTMFSYELIMEEEKEKNYLVEFENGTMLILIHLSPKGEISMFHIKDY